MKFCIVKYDRLFFHHRQVYVCVKDDELDVVQQIVLASQSFMTKFFADRWVKDIVFYRLEFNDGLEYVDWEEK